MSPRVWPPLSVWFAKVKIVMLCAVAWFGRGSYRAVFSIRNVVDALPSFGAQFRRPYNNEAT